MVKIHELSDQFSSTYIDSQFLGAKQTGIWVSDMDANNNSNALSECLLRINASENGSRKIQEER